ncbi:MAG: hypothetical protein WBE80_14065 [Methylocella sp.]
MLKRLLLTKPCAVLIVLSAIFAFVPSSGSCENLQNAPQINAEQKSDAGFKNQSQASDQKSSSTATVTSPPAAAPSVTTPESQRDAYHGDENGTEFWPPFFGLRLKITDSLLALFTFGLFIATWFLYVSTRDLVVGADRAAHTQLRAYVHFGGCRWISHTDRTDGHVFWRIRPRWVNNGSTPTRKLQIYAHYELLDNELPLSYSFAQDEQRILVPATIAPQGVVESGPHDISGDDLVAVSQGRKHLYVWGAARYRDVLPSTPEHITKFCVFATNLSGDPMRQWHAIDNPFEIMFATYPRHNCADDDCNQLS